MARQVIAVDCDDVLVPSLPALAEWYNERFDTKAQLKDFYVPDPVPWGAAAFDEVIARFEIFLRSEQPYELPLLPEAKAVLTSLRSRYDLYLVTGRSDYMEAATSQWAAKELPDVFKGIELTNYMVRSGQTHKTRSKAEVCNDLGAMYLIDDHLHHAEVVAASGVHVLLFGTYPWNQFEQPLPERIVRAVDWAAVKAYFDGR